MNFNTEIYKQSTKICPNENNLTIGDKCNYLIIVSEPYYLESLATKRKVDFVDCLCICGKTFSCSVRYIKNGKRVQVSCGCKSSAKKGSCLLDGMKKCSSCLLTLQESCFYNSIKRKDGKKPYCKSCQYLMRIKGTLNVDISTLVNSEIRCEVCDKPLYFPNKSNVNNETLCVDHNHQTNEYRGILCSNCNCALGSINDSKEIMESMIRYIRKHTNSKP